MDFEINQISLSPNKRLLAVAGAYHVAVVVLPRSGYSKLVTSRVDCKCASREFFVYFFALTNVTKISTYRPILSQQFFIANLKD